MKHVLLITIFSGLALGVTYADEFAPTPSQSSESTAPTRSYAQNYKDMALAFCISKAYATSSSANADAMATADGLDQWTNYDADASTGQLEKLVHNYLARNYLSIEGENVKLNLLKCIDLYHSKELAALTKRYVQKANHSYRQDNPAAK